MSRAHVVFDAQGEVTEYGLRPFGRIPRRASADEELELRALVGYAHERRGGPDARAAIEEIEAWHDRRYIRAWERRQRRLAHLLQLLREADPSRKEAFRAA